MGGRLALCYSGRQSYQRPRTLDPVDAPDRAILQRYSEQAAKIPAILVLFQQPWTNGRRRDEARETPLETHRNKRPRGEA